MMKLIDPTPVSSTTEGVTPPEVKGKRARWWVWTLLTVGAISAVAGIGYSQLRGPAVEVTASNESSKPAPEVKTIRPVRQSIRRTIEPPGRIEGFEQTPIQVKIPGFVQKWHADIGQRVEVGEVLADISVPEEREELKRREANVTLAAAEVTSAEKTLEAAIADETRSAALVRQAVAVKAKAAADVYLRKAEFRRAGSARDQGAASQSEYDINEGQSLTAEAALREAEAAIESANAGKSSATAARVKAEAGVIVSKAKLAVAAADARRQEEWLKYATVKAPFTGVISQRNVDVGQYVTPPTSGTAPPPLFVVVRTDPVRVFVDVPETEAAQIAIGMPAVVRVQAHGDREVKGSVTRFSWALDQNTRTLRVQIDLPNADGSLRPGMFAAARMVIERPGAWVVPAAAVITSDEQPFAVRLEDGKLFKTPVKLGSKQNGTFEILQKQTRITPRGEPIAWESLTGNEEFLTVRPAGWTDGMTVATGK